MEASGRQKISLVILTVHLTLMVILLMVMSMVMPPETTLRYVQGQVWHFCYTNIEHYVQYPNMFHFNITKNNWEICKEPFIDLDQSMYLRLHERVCRTHRPCASLNVYVFGWHGALS